MHFSQTGVTLTRRPGRLPRCGTLASSHCPQSRHGIFLYETEESSLLLLLLQLHLYVRLLGDQSVDVQDLLSEAWSAYWTITSRRSVETAVMYVIVTSLLTVCPAVCVYYSVRCTRIINSLRQYTHSLDSQTKVNTFLCRFLVDLLHQPGAKGDR